MPTVVSRQRSAARLAARAAGRLRAWLEKGGRPPPGPCPAAGAIASGTNRTSEREFAPSLRPGYRSTRGSSATCHPRWRRGRDWTGDAMRFSLGGRPSGHGRQDARSAPRGPRRRSRRSRARDRCSFRTWRAADPGRRHRPLDPRGLRVDLTGRAPACALSHRQPTRSGRRRRLARGRPQDRGLTTDLDRVQYR